MWRGVGGRNVCEGGEEEVCEGEWGILWVWRKCVKGVGGGENLCGGGW